MGLGELKTLLVKVDRILGPIVVRLLSKPKQFRFSEVDSILVIRPGGIGDAALLAPALSILKNTNPHIHITVLAEKRNSSVFLLIPGIDKVLCYDHPSELFQVLRGKYDAVIDTEQWYRLSAVVARLVKSPLKIGFNTNERRRMFTHGIRYDLTANETENFFALLKPLGVDCRKNIRCFGLSIPPQLVSGTSQLLQPLCSSSYVVIFPGASIEEKRWGVENFSLVSKRLSEDGYSIVVVGGREDRKDGDVIAGAGGLGGLNLAGKTTLAETAAVLARSSLVISGDSGVLHLAVGLDIPTVSLFGPSNSAKWAPVGEKHVVLNQNLICSPCARFGTTPPCPDGARCMVEITPDEVVKVSLFQLNRRTRDNKRK